MASKITTGLRGLTVVVDPRTELLKVYKKIGRALSKLPAESAYRQHTEVIINHRLNVVETTTDPREIEKKLDFQNEELIEHARDELALVNTMAKYKPWEPLVQQAPPNQWQWPV